MGVDGNTVGCLVFAILAGLLLVVAAVAVMFLPWWVTAALLALLFLWAWRVDRKAARKETEHLQTVLAQWADGDRLLAYIRIYYRPHGGHDEIEVVLGPEGGRAARRMHRWASAAEQPAEDTLETETATLDEAQAERMLTAVEDTDAWHLKDYRPPVVDGIAVDVLLFDGERLHGFRAEMPHGDHASVIQALVAPFGLDESPWWELGAILGA